MKHDARLDLRLSTELRDRVKAAAKGSVNEWVRMAILLRLEADSHWQQVDETPMILTGAAKPHRGPPAARPLEEIPLPKIAPRKWGS